MTIFLVCILSLLLGVGIGIRIGYHIWGPKWYDTSEGIDKKFRETRF